jgi:hypothetical protein
MNLIGAAREVKTNSFVQVTTKLGKKGLQWEAEFIMQCI